MRRSVVGILVGGAMVLVTADAHATTILPNCGTCGNHNTTWDLTLSLINDAENIYQLTVTAAYGNPVDFAFVNAVAFKIDAFVNNYDTSPTVSGPAEGGTWTVIPGGLSADGCNGSGNGFHCAGSPGSGASPSIGGTDTWTFLLNVNNNLANVLAATGSLKAHFVDSDGEKVGSLLSEGVTFGLPPNGPPPNNTPVPEPATLVLFGTGLAAVATAIRRRRKSQI